ncbi:MAG: tetratricopeptide repeat protein [Phycisphaerales bacterium]|nr:MAG: tetratricopeptide repeat protein [Phycisphaerales bacterium]
MSNARISRGITAWALTLTACAVTPALAGGSFQLTSAIPEDVFLCVASKHNPERDFLCEYWDEVFEALKASGVGSDLMGLISSQLGQEQQAEVDRVKDLVSRLIDGVDWDGLGDGEMVYAQRMGKPMKTSSGITLGPPGMAWVVRGTEGSASRNFDGLVTILTTLATEINSAAEGEYVAVDKLPRMGATVANMKLVGMPKDAPAINLAVALREDVIVVSMGAEMLEDVLGLMAGTSAKRAISQNPRFKEAFTKLPAPEDEMSFFDVQAMLGSFQAFAEVAFVAEANKAEKKSRGAVLNKSLSDEAKSLNSQAIKAYMNKDYAKALELIQKAYEYSPDSPLVQYNLACFHSLLGHKEEAIGWLEKAVDAGFNSPKQITKDPDLESLRDDPRYKAALAKAVEGEKTCCEGKKGGKLEMWKHLVDRLMDVPGMVDYVAAVVRTDGYSSREDTLTVLVPGASDKPFYPVFGRREAVKSYDTFLPKETVSFSVNSGIDLKALYKFIEDTIRAAGPDGEGLLMQWEGIQQAMGFNVHSDLLAWLDGEIVTAAMELPFGEAKVLMVKVADEAVAHEKISAALNYLSTSIQQMAQTQQNPMLAMLQIRVQPATHEKLTGFSNVTVGMSPQPMVVGVTKGYIMAGTSADAVALCINTAEGSHPNVKKNSRLMSEAGFPDGAFRSVTFTDQRKLGKEISEILGVIGMAGGMATMAIPDPEVQQILTKVLGMIMKLGPVANKIDFYKSTAKSETFDGKAWHARSVTNYQSPSERAATRKPAEGRTPAEGTAPGKPAQPGGH